MASAGPVVHSLKEFVEPELAMFGCVQSEVLLALNSVEPGRPSRPTWYVPVRGAMTVISNEPWDLKKTSLVESTPTDGLSLGAKGARKTTSHGGGGGDGEDGGDGSGGGDDGSGGGGDDGGCDGGIGDDGGCDGDGDGSGGGDDGGCDGDGDAAGPKSRTAA